jgi:hypothetical protein
MHEHEERIYFTPEEWQEYRHGEEKMCWLINVFMKRRKPVAPPSPTVFFVIKSAGIVYRTNQMTINLLDDQEVTITFSDIAGNEAPAGTQVTWASSDATIGTVTPSADTLTALVTTTGKLGTFTVTATDQAGAVATSTIVVGFDASSPALVAGTPVSRIAAPTPAPVATPTPTPAPTDATSTPAPVAASVDATTTPATDTTTPAPVAAS